MSNDEVVVLLDDLLDWAADMGGWEAPVWGRVQVARIKLSKGVVCGLCGSDVLAITAHAHQDGFVGDECGCWDERLRMTQ